MPRTLRQHYLGQVFAALLAHDLATRANRLPTALLDEADAFATLLATRARRRAPRKARQA